MKINLVEKVSKTELDEVKRMIGEAFVTNELFHEFGDMDSRRELVLKYMDIFTDYVYESRVGCNRVYTSFTKRIVFL